MACEKVGPPYEGTSVFAAQTLYTAHFLEPPSHCRFYETERQFCRCELRRKSKNAVRSRKTIVKDLGLRKAPSGTVFGVQFRIRHEEIPSNPETVVIGPRHWLKLT